MFKRWFDISLALVGLLLSSPLWLALALAIRLEDGGPVFYCQDRLGRGGKVFRVYKFRSMLSQPQGQAGPPATTESDPRVTRVGRFLRNTALDELPQLFNILKGDMSFVGPRPESPELAASYAVDNPHYHLRHTLRPGLTGPAQVYGHYDSPVEEKLAYEMGYLQRHSFWLDLKLLLLSFWITFKGKWEHRGRKW